ncbi:group II intron maturase-specific domain-containing protein, partial [Paraclostridium bifermentans]|uniref:group II intron maturase-specific domain-containing protein n=1 Tax=Paraclostridium bifermentans TaxID=1490 RepID=UPI0021F8E5BE
MIDGMLGRTERGIPQGWPLSPVLANIYLDQDDKEMESRGLRFTGYADDMLIYVTSEAAANRVMKSFSNYLEKKLKLEVNASESKVARQDEVKYLGFGFKRNKREWKAIPHEKSIHAFEQKIMKLTKRNWSVSLEERIEKINQVIRGWSNYFRCAWLYKATVRKMDSKLRRRIRAIIWKQWKSIRKKEE